MSLCHLATYQTHQHVIGMMKQSSDEQRKSDTSFFLTIVLFYFKYRVGPISFISCNFKMVEISLVSISLAGDKDFWGWS